MKMKDSMTDNLNDGEEEQEKTAGGYHRLRRFLSFLLILLLVLGVVVIAAYRDGTGFDSLRRFFSYGSAKTESGTVSYTYDASTENRFAVLNEGLVILSGTELRYIDQNGKQVCTENISMADPALKTGGGCAVAYDVGGTELYVLDEDGIALHLTAEEDEPYISASLNHEGWLAVTSEKRNYKGCVSVYDDKMELCFAFNSSERFLTGAQVADDCKTLAAVTLGQKNSVFISDLVLYDLSDTAPKTHNEVTDGLVFDTGILSTTLAAISDTGLTLADTSGEIKAQYGFSGDFLREYSLTGDGYAALLLNRYQSGNVGRLVVVSKDGTETASLDVHEEIRSISAAGRYIAVLYADRCVIYTEELQEYASLTGTGYAREALMRHDGSALLIAAEKANLFLP
jgi:hypothetical protein